MFVDGYLVTKMTVKGNKVNVFTTNSNKEYKSFEEKELVTKYMADLDNGIKAENDLRAAKEEVVAYFETKKIEKPILENARNEVSSREEKIADLKAQIKEVEEEINTKSVALESMAKDNNSRQDDKIVKKLGKEIDALKDKVKECNNQIIAVGKELDNEKDAKLSKKLTNEIKAYKDEIAELEKAKEENNTKIGDAENKIVLLEARAKDMNEGKTVAPNSELKSKQEYRNEIKKLNAANEKIDAQLTTLNEKVAAVEKTYVNNLGIKAQFAEAEKTYNANLAKVAPKSEVAKKEIEKIERANYDEAAAKPENLKKDTVTLKTARIENAKYEAAKACLEKQIGNAVKDVETKKNALRNEPAGNVYARAQEIFAQPKYAQLYNFINGYTPVFWGTNVSLKGKPGFGCLVVGPKLNEGKNVTGMSKSTLNRAMYVIVGKTVEEVRKALPETAEDFLNIDGADVYAADHISTKRDYSKAFFRAYKNTELLRDGDGNAILDANGRKQFAPSGKMTNITLDIRTDAEIEKFNEKQAEKAKKKGVEANQRKVAFTTPEMLEDTVVTLGKPECLDAERASYCKYDYTKSVVKKPLIIAAAVVGATLVVGGGVYAYTQYKAQADEISATIKDGEGFDTNKAFEYGKKQVGNNTIYYEYDKLGNVRKLEATSSELTKDINAYEDRNNAKGWTDCGAIYQYVYNTTMKLGEEKNILQLDGNMLYNEYFAGLSLTTYEEETSGNWVIANAEAPKDANGKIISTLQYESARQGFEDAAKEIEKTNPETAGTSAIDPLDPALNDATQDRINKDTKGTKKTMVVEGVYVDFSKDTAFAVSSDGKNIVKLTYAEDIKTYQEAVDGMVDTTSDWYTCAAANPNLPGERYQNYYVSDKTVKSGETYNKNIVEVEKDGSDYIFTEFKGYDVINTDKNIMPSGNDIAYVAIAGNAANVDNCDYLAVGGAQGTKTVYAAQTPENTTTNTVGQIFGYVNPKTANVSDGMSK